VNWEKHTAKSKPVEFFLKYLFKFLHGIRAMSGGRKFVIEPQSPYYPYPSEGPGVVITSVILNGKNYELWRKAVRTALKSNNKLGFIEGTLVKPTPKEGEDVSELVAWEMANSMICSWTVNVIDPYLHANVAYADTAKAMWENLSKRYAIDDTPKVHKLRPDLASCKQESLEVTNFYSKLTGLWSDLDNYTKIPHYTCGKCKCTIGEQIMKMVDKGKTHQFLMGLNDELFQPRIAKFSHVLPCDP